jgi:hypothetical protein
MRFSISGALMNLLLWWLEHPAALTYLQAGETFYQLTLRLERPIAISSPQV